MTTKPAAEPLLKGRARSRSGASSLSSSPTTNNLIPLPLSARSSSMPTDREPGAHRRGLPPWDRSFDAVCHRYAHDERRVDKSSDFSAALDSFFVRNGRTRVESGYFRLPDNLRQRVCQYLLAGRIKLRPRPIELNSHSFNRDVWRSEDFKAFSKAFAPLAPYLAVSFSFRADILLTFLAQKIFHVTFSPYVKPRTSPLATNWLNRYSPYMQNIIVEVDLTRLGHGPTPEAVNLLPLDDSVEALLQDFVQVQLEREESRPLDSLVVLCRRFYGRRSDDANTIKPSAEHSGRGSAQSHRSQRSSLSSRIPSRGSQDHDSSRNMSLSPVHSLRQCTTPTGTPSGTPTPSSAADDSLINTSSPDPRLIDWPTSPLSLPYQLEYCSDAVLAVCNHLVLLNGRVDSLRLCGFSETYASRFIASFFPHVRQNPEKHSYRVSPSTIWPRLSGQRSYIDIGDGCVLLDDHGSSPIQDVTKAAARWEGCYQLPPPSLDSGGYPSLPYVVDTLQKIRTRAIEPNPGMAMILQSQPQLVDAVAQVGNDKKRILRLLDKYGRAKGLRKRAFTREIAATL